MRLTQTIRQAFVSSAMNDVPSIDYDTPIRARVNELYLDALKSLEMPADKQDRYSYCTAYTQAGSVSIRGMQDKERDRIQADPLLVKLEKSHLAQASARDTLEQKLTGIANSVSSRKALIELLPEFEKYLPAESAKSANLPAISNMVGDFIRAGWPKNKGIATAGATP